MKRSEAVDSGPPTGPDPEETSSDMAYLTLLAYSSPADSAISLDVMRPRRGALDRDFSAPCREGIL
jgi:hypothetical protein